MKQILEVSISEFNLTHKGQLELTILVKVGSNYSKEHHIELYTGSITHDK